MHQNQITVISVSWRSTGFLQDMLAGLLALADRPDAIRLLIADNTDGNDPDLARLRFPDLTIRPVDVAGTRMSVAHALGLNALLPHVETRYTLIIDPDVAVFAAGWDTTLIAALDDPNTVAVGAPYPPWKLGKYHDFPSPPFAFWQTNSLMALKPDWRPYGRTLARRVIDFALRQTFWIPRVIDRYVLRLPRRRFKISRWNERLTGVVSKDTGWEVAQRARRRGWRSRVFDVLSPDEVKSMVPGDQGAAYAALAGEFELYAWAGEPFLTHRNPTLTQLDFNLWTDSNVLIYQDRADKADQTARWRELVQTVNEATG
jgi:hypothetical protein